MIKAYDLRQYYHSFPNDFENGISLEDFYKLFPFKKERKRESKIDRKFFIELMPIINLDFRNFAKEPINLNVWDGFGIGESELKHCSFLSWLFDSSANHYQKEHFLRIFLEVIGSNELLPFIKNGYYVVKTEDQSNYGRVDITISNQNFIIVIEIKIKAIEQPDQIQRYNELLNKKSKFFGIERKLCKTIFLTIDGKKPESGDADHNISWKDVCKASKLFSFECPNDFVSQLVTQYYKYIDNLLY